MQGTSQGASKWVWFRLLENPWAINNLPLLNSKLDTISTVCDGRDSKYKISTGKSISDSQMMEMLWNDSCNKAQISDEADQRFPHPTLGQTMFWKQTSLVHPALSANNGSNETLPRYKGKPQAMFNDRCIHFNSLLSVHQEIRSLKMLSVFYFLYYNCCFTSWREYGISVSLSSFLNTALRVITPSNHSLSDVIIPLK